MQKVLSLCAEYIPQHYPWLNPVNDVQVLAPMHKGVAGVANLNQQLQAALKPARTGAASRAGESLRTVAGEFRAGDKLIQLRNNYDTGLFNGDIGVVLSVDAGAGTLTADFDGERHAFARADFGDVALAYCISIHKSQGSEYPAVVVPLLKSHFVMLQRNLLYTALTRGKKKVFLVGEPAAYAMAVRNSESKQRCTHLREKILQMISPAGQTA
jgi:exodeoxyribonuclease V alpha subunit